MSIYTQESSGLVDFNDSLFFKSLLSLITGLFIAIVLYHFNYRKINSISWFIYTGTLIILLLTRLLGARHGILALQQGVIQLNFLSVAPFLLIIALSGLFSRWNWQKPWSFWKALCLVIIPEMFFLFIPSIATAVIYLLVSFVLLIIAGAQRRHILLASGVPPLLLWGAIIQEPYRMLRLSTLINPFRDPLGWDYPQVIAMKAIRTAGFWGQGFTFPTHTLPEIHTNMVFTYLVFTFGWLAGLAVLALTILLIIRLVRLCGQVKDLYGRLLSLTLIHIHQ